MSPRLRDLRAEPYSQKEAEAAVGLWTDNGIPNSTKAGADEEQPAAMEVESAGIL